MVYGLKKWVEIKMPSAFKTIDIEREIHGWKIKNNGVTPKIVIDFPGFYRFMDQCQLDIILGNQQNALNDFESMLLQLTSMGVELVFFYGGPSKYLNKPDAILKRHERSIQSLNYILEMINNNEPLEVIVENIKDKVYNSAGYFLAVVMLAEKYGKLYKSYYNEYERDIALYASKHNAVAVMSGNTDFIIIDGPWKFWSVQERDPLKFEVLEIDKIKVRQCLGLNNYQLLIFGVLTAKNFPDPLVHNFLKSLGKNMNNRFANLTKFIAKNWPNITKTPSSREIACLLSPNNLDDNAKITEGLFTFFDNKTEPTSIYESKDYLSSIVKQMHNTYVFDYLHDILVPIGLSFFDVRQPEYANFSSAALQMLQRQMGIVLQHKGGEPIKRSFICYNPSDIITKSVVPEYPSLMVPPLQDLYQNPNDQIMLDTKFTLLCWIVSDNVKHQVIQNIPKAYLCSVLTLIFMVEKKFITTEEADLILYCLKQSNEGVIKLVENPERIAERPFQLVFLYDKFYQLMAISINTVGLKEFLVYNQLNGAYFHLNYQPIMDMSIAKRENLLNTMNGYCVYRSIL